MKFKLMSSGLAILTFVFLAPAHTAQQSNPFLRLAGNGWWWTSLSANAKENFVDGYATAMESSNYMVHAECMEEIKEGNEEPRPDPSNIAALNAANAAGQVRIDAADRLCTLADLLDYTKIDKHKMMDAVDELYSDSQNARLPIEMAMEYARDELSGKKSANELEDELTEWRNPMKK